MYDFSYHRPSSVRQAVNLLNKIQDAKLLAGGQTLIPTMKQRLASPANLIDLSLVEELVGIELKGRSLDIGAMTRHADVATSEAVQANLPALGALAGKIGDPHVRHMGTIGGSLANNDPNADYPAAVLGMGATIVTNKRKIAADEFFTGLFETALARDEIVVRVSFPIPRRAGYAKFHQPASRFALVGVFVAELSDGSVRVAVTGAGPNVFRASAIETALRRDFTAAAAEAVSVSADNLNSDLHGSPEYRAHLIPVLAGRAVAAAH